MSVQIEFGGGEYPRRPHYTQCDIRQITPEYIACEAWNIGQHIKSNSVENIYSRHFFEHLTHSQSCRTLRAWYRIGKKGCKVELICPDMEFHIKQWNNWSNLSDIEKDHCRAGFWGWQRDEGNSWDLHKTGYNFQILKEHAIKHGFSNVKRVEPFGAHLSVEFFK